MGALIDGGQHIRYSGALKLCLRRNPTIEVKVSLRHGLPAEPERYLPRCLAHLNGSALFGEQLNQRFR